MLLLVSDCSLQSLLIQSDTNTGIILKSLMSCGSKGFNLYDGLLHFLPTSCQRSEPPCGRGQPVCVCETLSLVCVLASDEVLWSFGLNLGPFVSSSRSSEESDYSAPAVKNRGES